MQADKLTATVDQHSAELDGLARRQDMIMLVVVSVAVIAVLTAVKVAKA